MSSNPAARRRPTHRKGRPTLTRESVGRAALDFLDHHGPAELTMRSLAADLDVSPRALYNYVEDRRDLLTVAAELFESEWRPPELESGRWRESLRSYCRALRAHYRSHPGMTTLALTENITMARHPTMLRNVDTLIGSRRRGCAPRILRTPRVPAAPMPPRAPRRWEICRIWHGSASWNPTPPTPCSRSRWTSSSRGSRPARRTPGSEGPTGRTRP
ncbi:TetR/AcrR family transcriptional regulator [Streptomyces phaeochromogenes]|uniref:TetR/AcrR family transcriptional regulator n=1 Tax=Streptomyces phaeochromogenes TaxID=1923 RepID=UPI00386A773A|nr:TetR/AcrR family transcriptional regulator [Streptomyces phaeochromogenes]WTA08912.1 TetR/AcrR family transcriptional regulator [Streptomyces phaeochromogenes]